jgi:cytosine/adenosine deaminase-related metal-dependent hydrolase
LHKTALIKTGKIVTVNPQREIIHQGGILIEDNRILQVLTQEQLRGLNQFEDQIVDASDLVAIPGFVQTHIHLCQTLFRGLADDLELLDWLQLKIFPFEAAHNEKSIYSSAMLGISELVRSGTTTIMDMGTLDFEEEIIRAIDETGLRAFVGKAMMDINPACPNLKETTENSVRSSLGLAEKFHNHSTGRLKYAFAPRYVLSCTDQLMREAYELTKSFGGSLYHTHASENRKELDAVRVRCKMDNVEYLDKLGVLGQHSCLAHCIWLNEKEIELLKTTGSKVLHCPSSNLKLGSGIANIPLYLERGISVSLGADGAPCNNNLDVFTEMRLAALIQKPTHQPTAMPAKTVFELATMGGAAALHLQNEIGSLEAGKKADVVLLSLNKVWNPVHQSQDEQIYSTIVYSCRPENVDSVMIDGRWIMRSGELLGIDEEKTVAESAVELQNLLNRV